MFEDDRGRLKRIGDFLDIVQEVLAGPETRLDDVVWYQLGRIHHTWSGVTPAYRASHPEIDALGLPTFDEVMACPFPIRQQFEAVGNRAIAAFAPLLANPPPPPAAKPRKINPKSRFDLVFETLRRLEPELRSQGVSALYIFGSVARREDTDASDVDIAFEVTVDQNEAFSLFDRARLAQLLQDALGRPTDFVTLSGFHDDVHERIRRDMVRVWG